MNMTFIGGGNMARALIGGLLAKQEHELSVVDPNPEARSALEEFGGLDVFGELPPDLADSDVVVLAVKPQILTGVLQQLAPVIRAETCLLSVAAGFSVAAMESALQRSQPIVRSMPNTPALLGCGITGLFANAACGQRERRAADQIMGAVGETIWVDEEDDMNAVTALSGSGPAYFYLMIEALRDAGETLGLSRETATRLVIQTAHGAGAMAAQPAADPTTLRARVTSPGGTTAAGIDALEAGGFRALVKQAAKAARDRGRELAGGGKS